jgi:hypothetical protein
MVAKGSKVKNVHTGEVLDVDHVPVHSHADIRPVYVLSDGSRWSREDLFSHWEEVSDEDTSVQV